MDITKVYKEGSVIHAVEITDGEGDSQIKYPILVSSLKNPMIFQELLKSGWEFYGLPHDFKKGNISVDKIQSEEKSFAQFSLNEQQAMFDINEELYQDSEVAQYVVKGELSTVKSKDVLFLGINTREELLTFLKDWNFGRVQKNDPRYYLPINSFTNTEALFTLEEYSSGEYSDYVEILSRHRVVDTESYELLCIYFITHGLDSKFTAKQFIDMYMSWGFPGVKLNVVSTREEILDKILGSTGNSDIVKPRLYRRGFIDRQGEIYAGSEEGDKAYTPDYIGDTLDNFRNEAHSYSTSVGEDVMVPVELSKRITSYATYVEFDEGTLVYNESTYIFQTRDIRRASMGEVFRVELTASQGAVKITGANLDMFHNETVKKNLYNKIMLRAIERHLVSVKTEEVEVSSRNALYYSSVGPASQLRYIGKRIIPALVSDPNKAGAKLTKDELNAIEGHISDMTLYFEGEKQLEDLDEETLTLVEDHLAGNTNVDSVVMGIRLDESSSDREIYHVLEACVNVFGLEPKEIYQQVRNVTFEDPYVIIRSPKGNAIINLPKRDNAKKHYAQDIRAYQQARAEDPEVVLYITHAFREMGVKERKFEHMGFRALGYITVSEFDPMRNHIRGILEEIVESNIRLNDQPAYMAQLNVLLYEAIFSIYLSGRIKVKFMSLDIDMPVSENVINAVKSAILPRFESIPLFTDRVVHFDGNFRFHVVNASITPTAVVPYRGMEILEMSPKYYWESFPAHDIQTREKLFNAGQIPSIDWEGGYQLYAHRGELNNGHKLRSGDIKYQKVVAIEGGVEGARAEKASFLNYMESYYEYLESTRDGEQLPDPAPFTWRIYPHLFEAELDKYETDNPVIKVESGTKSTPFAGKVVPYTREAILNARPELRPIFDPTVRIENAIDSVGKITRFEGLTAEELYIINDPDKVLNISEFNQPRIFIINPGQNTAFAMMPNEELKELNPSQISMLDKEEFAVKEILNGSYLIKDTHDRLYRVRTH